MRPRRSVVITALAVLVVVGFGGWLVGFSSVFGVKTIAVRGTSVLRVDEVRAAAGIADGTPLVRLDTGAVIRRVERLPVVAAAKVQTRYPGTVTITITERAPVGYLESGAHFALVDRTGAQYRNVAARPARLPLFAVPSGVDATPVAQAVATVAGALSSSLLPRIGSIQALDPTSITLVLVDHRVVRWGTAARSADKATILSTLLAQPGTHFDVTDPDQVYAR